jgi:exopolyphosphatase/guanosine-5'-triphosphate,3'-diphosphate pyrophosphatase
MGYTRRLLDWIRLVREKLLRPANPVIGAVDIGSNTIKMSVATLTATGDLHELAAMSETVRLGAGLATSGVLAKDRVAHALEILTRFAATAHELGATRLVGVATEATRRAGNGPAFLADVRTMTGWDVRAISGDDEADLTFRGLAHDHDVSGRVIVADLGGGSTEIVIAEAGRILQAQSLPLGSGTLTDAFIRSDPPHREELDACIDTATSALVTMGLSPAPDAHLIVIGGTAEHIGKLLSQGRAPLPGDVAPLLDWLTRTTAAILTARHQVPPDRARVLPAGIAIVGAIVDYLTPERMSLGRSGIRTGLLLATFEQIAGNPGTTKTRG